MNDRPDSALHKSLQGPLHPRGVCGLSLPGWPRPPGTLMSSSLSHLPLPWSCYLSPSPGWRWARPGSGPGTDPKGTSLCCPNFFWRCPRQMSKVRWPSLQVSVTPVEQGQGPRRRGATGSWRAIGSCPHTCPTSPGDTSPQGKLGSPVAPSAPSHACDGQSCPSTTGWSSGQPRRPAAAFRGASKSTPIAWELLGLCPSIRGWPLLLAGPWWEEHRLRTQGPGANGCLPSTPPAPFSCPLVLHPPPPTCPCPPPPPPPPHSPCSQS